MLSGLIFAVARNGRYIRTDFTWCMHFHVRRDAATWPRFSPPARSRCVSALFSVLVPHSLACQSSIDGAISHPEPASHQAGHPKRRTRDADFNDVEAGRQVRSPDVREDERLPLRKDQTIRVGTRLTPGQSVRRARPALRRNPGGRGPRRRCRARSGSCEGQGSP